MGGPIATRMQNISYAGYRFPPEIIQQAIWLYVRFALSFRDVEDLLAERGIAVFYETVRRWVITSDQRSLLVCESAAQSLAPRGIWTRSI